MLRAPRGGCGAGCGARLPQRWGCGERPAPPPSRAPQAAPPWFWAGLCFPPRPAGVLRKCQPGSPASAARSLGGLAAGDGKMEPGRALLLPGRQRCLVLGLGAFSAGGMNVGTPGE